MFEFERAVAEKEDEEAMYHFIGYMPVRGRLYELDGCNPGPIDHGIRTRYTHYTPTRTHNTILTNRALALGLYLYEYEHLPTPSSSSALQDFTYSCTVHHIEHFKYLAQILLSHTVNGCKEFTHATGCILVSLMGIAHL